MPSKPSLDQTSSFGCINVHPRSFIWIWLQGYLKLFSLLRGFYVFYPPCVLAQSHLQFCGAWLNGQGRPQASFPCQGRAGSIFWPTAGYMLSLYGHHVHGERVALPSPVPDFVLPPSSQPLGREQCRTVCGGSRLPSGSPPSPGPPGQPTR